MKYLFLLKLQQKAYTFKATLNFHFTNCVDRSRDCYKSVFTMVILRVWNDPSIEFL